jgi:formiminoglutamase
MTDNTEMPWLHVHQGTVPLLISLPHTGTTLPPEIDDGRLVSRSRALRDTDWYIDQLYDFAIEMGASSVRTEISRTVIDVNRNPSGASLYPGQATTGLCPTETFDGDSLYHPGREPYEAEIAMRRARWFDPYHAALEAEIARMRGVHGKIVVYDCHSIRSVVPRLFDGELPNFNIGTNEGRSCSLDLTEIVAAACDHFGYSSITDGRFKGGWITRHYGSPFMGIHAIQMELACRGYMRETEIDDPAPYDPDFAAPMIKILRQMFESMIAFAAR